MSRKTVFAGVAVALLLTCTAAVATRSLWRAESAMAPAAAPGRSRSRWRPHPQDAPGSDRVARHRPPIASVAIKARLETVITQVHFADGAEVKQGDLLFTLDSRQIEAEIRKVEALIAGAQAQLQQAERDVARYTDLLAKNATTVVTLNNAQTQVILLRAAAESNKAHWTISRFSSTSPGSGRRFPGA